MILKNVIIKKCEMSGKRFENVEKKKKIYEMCNNFELYKKIKTTSPFL